MVLPLSYWHCLGISCLCPCCVFYLRVPLSAQGVWGHGRHIFIIDTCTRTHTLAHTLKVACLFKCSFSCTQTSSAMLVWNFSIIVLSLDNNGFLHVILLWGTYLSDNLTFWYIIQTDVIESPNECGLWELILSGMRNLDSMVLHIICSVGDFSFLVTIPTLFWNV